MVASLIGTSVSHMKVHLSLSEAEAMDKMIESSSSPRKKQDQTLSGSLHLTLPQLPFAFP